MKPTHRPLLISLLTAAVVIFSCEKLDIQKIMVLKTKSVNDITGTTANVKGEIVDLGEGMTDHGVYYSTSPNAKSGTKLSQGTPTGIGEFTVLMNNLAINTKYYVCVYGARGNTLVYGEETNFTTDNQPTVTLNSVNNITATSAYCVSNITSDGGEVITECGICCSTSQNPTIDDAIKINNNSVIGSFISEIFILVPDTKYYVRAYAINNVGTNYSNEIIFTTTKTISDIDGNIYNVIQIGAQVWMAENLKSTRFTDGTAIPYTTNNAAWVNENSSTYCWYNNEIQNKENYGALYNKITIIDSHHLCPKGWHIPTEIEWKQLENFLGGSSIAGGKLKAKTIWKYPNTGATNESGFSAFPGGSRSAVDGSFVGLYAIGEWWSSPRIGDAHSYSFSLYYYDSYSQYYYTNFFDGSVSVGRSVRCVRDN
ncbi:MAG: fibrobacter succinogenes major paralogous domain-containing protein [Tenuifilaceae bacterium]